MAEVIDPALATAGKPLELGQDPTKYLERLDFWYNHTSLLADSIGEKDKQQKLQLTLLWGGHDIPQFAEDAGVVHKEEGADTLENAIEKVREACRKHVNLSMAMYKLMHAKQGTKILTESAKKLDQLATQCQFDKSPYTKNGQKRTHSFLALQMRNYDKRLWPKILITTR